MPFAAQSEYGNFRYTPKISARSNGTFGVVIVIVANSGPDRAIVQTFEPPVATASAEDALWLGDEWARIWIDSQS